MMFSLIIFYWSTKDGHSKREVLEIFNMNQKNAIARFLFLNRPPISQWFTIFSTQYLYFKMLRTMSSLFVSNFDPASSSMPKL